MIVCICNNISDKTIDLAIQKGNTSVASICKSLGIKLKCGTCKEHIKDQIMKSSEQKNKVLDLQYKILNIAGTDLDIFLQALSGILIGLVRTNKELTKDGYVKTCSLLAATPDGFCMVNVIDDVLSSADYAVAAGINNIKPGEIMNVWVKKNDFTEGVLTMMYGKGVTKEIMGGTNEI